MWSDGTDLLLPSPDIWEEPETKKAADVGTTRGAIEGVFRGNREATADIKQNQPRKPERGSEGGAVPIGTIVANMRSGRPEFADLVHRTSKPSHMSKFKRLLQVWESSSYRRAMGAGFMGAVVIVTGFAIISWLS